MCANKLKTPERVVKQDHGVLFHLNIRPISEYWQQIQISLGIFLHLFCLSTELV